MSAERTADSDPNAPDPETKLVGPALWRLAARDVVLIAIVFTVPFRAAFFGASRERTVCARVLEIGKDGRARIDYWWEGRLYTKSVPLKESFKPGKITISMHFVGSPENAVEGRGGHFPYTISGTFLMVIPLFLAGGLMMALIRFVWGQRFAPAARMLLDLVTRRFGKQPTARARFFVCVVIGFICLGIFNVWESAKRPGVSPDRLGSAFLAAVRDRDLNKAAYLVQYDDRYAFLTDSRSWALLNYDVTRVEEDAVSYHHTSEVDGRRVTGESVLPVVHDLHRYWIGHVSMPVAVRNRSLQR